MFICHIWIPCHQNHTCTNFNINRTEVFFVKYCGNKFCNTHTLPKITPQKTPALYREPFTINSWIFGICFVWLLRLLFNYYWLFEGGGGGYSKGALIRGRRYWKKEINQCHVLPNVYTWDYIMKLNVDVDVFFTTYLNWLSKRMALIRRLQTRPCPYWKNFSKNAK